VPTLILFDIDGTLVLTGGAGARAMAHAFREVFGIDDGLAAIPMAGRTDAWIVGQMAARHGVTCDDACLRRFHAAYVGHLAREVLEPGPRKGVLPGVRHLLDTLASRTDAYLGLLTGNFRRGAEIKLQHFDLWRYFAAGAFGDASHDRNGLLTAALTNVAEAGGPVVNPADVVIVGDTPLDIAVAVAGGARSVGVATGSYAADALRHSGADVVFEDLSDRDAVLKALGLEP
jgi:phosphoglycolate phosphatase